jgi:hypothetical protein
MTPSKRCLALLYREGRLSRAWSDGSRITSSTGPLKTSTSLLQLRRRRRLPGSATPLSRREDPRLLAAHTRS